MSTETNNTGIDPQVMADLDAVMKRIIDGTPVDPETSQRIRTRAERITEDLRRRNVQIDIHQLLHDDDEL